MYAPLARGRLTLLPHINEEALEGLEEYSHIWLVFVFHQSSHSQFKTKIKPPRLMGKKKGIFATRSPNRFNPIGMSVVVLESISHKTLHLSGVDLVEGTPVLDIKPYHTADCLQSFKVPAYLTQEGYSVNFHPRSLEQLEEILNTNTLKFYTREDNLCEVIRSCLAQDPSTVHTKLKHPQRGLYAFALDSLEIAYVRDSQALTMEVVLIEVFSGEKPKMRSFQWLESTLLSLKKMGFEI